MSEASSEARVSAARVRLTSAGKVDNTLVRLTTKPYRQKSGQQTANQGTTVMRSARGSLLPKCTFKSVPKRLILRKQWKHHMH